MSLTAEQVRRLPRHERRKLLAQLRERMPPIRLRYNGHLTPTPKQYVFLALDCMDAFYGGAAGPGKSMGLLLAALQYCDVPGYDAILFRRTYPELARPGGLIPASKELLFPQGIQWNQGQSKWTFPSGATLTLAHMQYEDDRFNYNGPEFNFIGFDEVTTFTERQFRYLFSRLRRPTAGSHHGAAADGVTIDRVPSRMRSASNPGGPGHDWVKERYVDPTTRGTTRRFVRAKMHENPHLDVESYLAALSELTATDRDRLVEGDWDVADEGAVFKRHWFTVVDEAPPASQTVRTWDCAATEPSSENPDPDWTVGMRVSWSARAKRYTVEHIIRTRVGPGATEKLLRQTAASDGITTRVYGEQEPGSSGKEVAAQYKIALRGYIVKWEPSSGAKQVRAKVAAAQAENGLIQIVRGPWLADFLDELSRFPGGHDDQVDCLSKAIVKLRPRRTGTILSPAGSLPR